MIKPLYRFFNAEGLLKDSSVLFAGLAGAMFFNLLFQMVMGRSLSSDEFALLVMFLGVFNVLSFPLNVVSVAVSRYSSLLASGERTGDIPRLISYWGMRLGAIGGALSLLCFVFPHPIAAFFGLDRVAPVYIFATTLVGIFCRPVVLGALLGLQRFGGWCLCNVLGAVMRVFVGAILVIFVSPYAGWGLLGNGVGFYFAMLAGVVLLYASLKGKSASRETLPDMRGYLLSSFFILLGYAVLMTGDVIIMKQRFPDFAGDFAYAATLAHLVLLGPQALVGAMFPKVVSENQGTQTQFRLFKKTLLATVLSAAGTAVVFSMCARLFARWIFNIPEPSVELVRWCRMLSWVMVPVAALNVPMRFALAQHRLRIAAVVPLAAVFYLGLAYLAASGPDTVLYALGAVSLAALLVLGFSVGLRAKVAVVLVGKETGRE